MGWIGVSNAGGVQLNTAALDNRVDAIVPMWAWGDLIRDLLPNHTVKQSWALFLYGGGVIGASLEGLPSSAGPQTGNFAPMIHKGFAEIAATGDIAGDVGRWFRRRSTVARSERIQAPALIVQGAIDTHFPLEDGFENFRNVLSAGTPAKLIAYCNGHTVTGCPYPGGDSGYPNGPAGRMPVWEVRQEAPRLKPSAQQPPGNFPGAVGLLRPADGRGSVRGYYSGDDGASDTAVRRSGGGFPTCSFRR
ncbi:MAG TPA: hypothetical protein VE975_09010 [Actinomycetota bacterium]|nr:hypothetical protein [Actinomycetota bacterium]